jgi:hypothetical protein
MANVLDLYLGLKTDEELISSQEYKLLKDNKIDTALLDGEDPDPNAGEVQLGKIDKAEETTLFDDTIDFVKSMPKDMLLSVTRGTMNGFGFVNSATNAVGINPDSSYEFVKDKIDNQMKSLDELDKDSPFVSKMLAIVAQDAAYIVPTYKKFKSLGLPKQYALPLAFGVGQALAFDKEMSMLVDTDAVKSLKRYANIEEGTGTDDMVDNALLAIEGSSIGYLFDKMGPVLKGIKNSNWQQNSMAVGGSAATGEIVDKLNDNTNELNVQDQNLEEKKKILNSDEQTNSSTVNEYGFELNAGIVPVFKSVLKEAAKKIPNKGSGEQILGQLRNTPGLKQQELKWSGLDDFLKEKKKVTKDEIQEYLNANTLDVSEVRLPRQVKTDPKLDNLYKNINEDYGKLYDELGTLPQNQGRMVDPFRYTVTNTLDDGRRVNEVVSMDTLDNIFIGQRLNSYIPPNAMMSKGKYFDRSKLINDFGKKGDQNTLEFYMFEDSVSGRVTAHTRKNYKDVIGQEDLMSGGKYEFTGITEMNIKEAEMYMFMKIRDKLERVVSKDRDKGKTKFNSTRYNEPGGKDYKELIFKLKGDRNFPRERMDFNKNELVIDNTYSYRSPSVHFGTENEFAHVRFKTRDLNGQKVLAVEEMQSDAVQDMKKVFGESTKDFPFKNNWYELVTKRLIRYAADNNLNAVAIPKGSVAMKRYNQSFGKATEVNVIPGIDQEYNKKFFKVKYFGGGNREIKNKLYYTDEIYDLEKEIGSENFKSLKGNIDNFLQNDNLTKADIRNEYFFSKFNKPIMIGEGKGKVELYDKVIPSFMKKYGKKWNAKVYDDNIPTLTEKDYSSAIAAGQEVNIPKGMPVTIIQLTDDMKKSVQTDGQALFNIFGIGTAGAAGANTISDNMKNNIISETTKKE